MAKFFDCVLPAIGTHHLEYGFPSTHSTNSVSMALFIFGYVRNAYIESTAISSSPFYASCTVLVIYAVTVVFGRLYTGMHSFTDCVVGVSLGVIIWGAYAMMKETFGNWLATAHWIGETFHPCWYFNSFFFQFRRR